MQPGYYYVVYGFETQDDINVGPYDTAEEAEEREFRMFPAGAVTSQVCYCLLEPVVSEPKQFTSTPVDEIPY